MPELAEVEFYRHQWAAGLGEKVTRVSLHPKARNFRDTKPAALRKALTGSTFRTAEAHGKQMLFGFSGGSWMGAHLGMTGQLLVAGPAHKPEKHDHLVLVLQKRTLVYRDPRMFGRIRYQNSLSKPDWWRQLPPSILSDAFTLQHLEAFLERHPKPLIKPLLLDQEAFPGIGNWMADEVLWRARIPPTVQVGELDEKAVGAIWKHLRNVSRDALAVIGKDWGDPPDTWLFNHRWKDGGFCPRKRCRSPLLREEIRGRTTCWCPVCQSD